MSRAKKVNWKSIFKRQRAPKAIPVNTRCRNCDTETVGCYCHQCGQSITAGAGQPIIKLSGQLLENAFAVDAKTPLTLGYLLTRPGFLSAEYRAGHINRYVHPVKLFWMSVLLFVFVAISDIDWSNDEEKGAVKAPHTTEQVVAVSQTDKTVEPATEASGSKTREKRKEELKQAFTPEKMRGYVSTYASYVMFLFIPVFALLLKLFFWRNRFYYMFHLVFTTHFYTFLLLYYSLLFGIDSLWPDWEWADWLSLTFLILVPAVYFMLALYRFYRPRHKHTVVWKAVFITLLYSLLVLTVVVLLAIAIAAMYGLAD